MHSFEAVRSWSPERRRVPLKGRGPVVPLHQQVAALSCTNASVVISGVINFSPEIGIEGRHTGNYKFNPKIAHTAQLQLQQLSTLLDRCIPPELPRHRFRSEASVDDDVCFFATAKFFLHSVGGLSETVHLVRSALDTPIETSTDLTVHAANQPIKPKVANNCKPLYRGLMPELSRAVYGGGIDGLLSRPYTTVPPKGSCAYERAECAHRHAPRSWESMADEKIFIKGRASFRPRVPTQEGGQGTVFPLYKSSMLARPVPVVDPWYLPW